MKAEYMISNYSITSKFRMITPKTTIYVGTWSYHKNSAIYTELSVTFCNIQHAAKNDAKHTQSVGL
jgi:hypothetical protein